MYLWCLLFNSIEKLLLQFKKIMYFYLTHFIISLSSDINERILERNFKVLYFITHLFWTKRILLNSLYFIYYLKIKNIKIYTNLLFVEIYIFFLLIYNAQSYTENYIRIFLLIYLFLIYCRYMMFTNIFGVQLWSWAFA